MRWIGRFGRQLARTGRKHTTQNMTPPNRRGVVMSRPHRHVCELRGGDEILTADGCLR